MTESLNLFGELQEDKPIRRPSDLSEYQRRKIAMKYRKAVTKQTSCQTCKFLKGIRYHGHNYYKCILIGESASAATDIRLSNVCDRYQRRVGV